MCGTISRVPRRTAISIVFLAGLAILGWNAGGPGIATAYVDPLARIQAQDEAYYGAIAIDVAEHGHLLTPRFLYRYALAKPLLAIWAEAAAVKTIGRGALALRLPSIVAGAATLALVFWWLLEESVSLAAALTAVLLLLSSHLFFVLSRVGLTDAILMFTTTLAMFALARDRRLSTLAGLWTFGLASGAAILTKGLAGLFALLALALFCVISKEHPNWRRLAQVVAISAGVAAPWHLYRAVAAHALVLGRICGYGTGHEQRRQAAPVDRGIAGRVLLEGACGRWTLRYWSARWLRWSPWPASDRESLSPGSSSFWLRL